MLNKLKSKIPSNIANAFELREVNLEDVREDSQLREIIEQQFESFSKDLGFHEDKYLTVKNLKDITILNIDESLILVEPKVSIPYLKPLEVNKEFVFFKGYKGQTYFKTELKRYMNHIGRLEFNNMVRDRINKDLKEINKEHNGLLTYRVLSENENQMFLMLENKDKEVITNVTVLLSDSMTTIIKILKETKENNVIKIKETLFENHIKDLNENFDKDRITYGEEFSFEMNGDIVLSVKDNNLTELLNCIKLENLFLEKYPMLGKYLKFLTLKTSLEGFDKNNGSLGVDSDETHVKEVAFFMMNLIKQYKYIQFHPYFTDIPFEENEFEWCQYSFKKDSENKTISITLGNEPSYIFNYDEDDTRIS